MKWVENHEILGLNLRGNKNTMMPWLIEYQLPYLLLARGDR